MFGYYLRLGARSLRRNPVLTALMVLTLAIGVAASISTLTILHVMSGDPIPHKSTRLFSPLVDNAPLKTYVPGYREPFAVQMTYQDTVNLLASGQGAHRTAVLDVAGSIEAPRPDKPPMEIRGVAVNSDFFGMFEVPFLQGGAWSAGDDKSGARVAILTRKKAEALFGTGEVVGKRFRLWSREFQVVGVLKDWNPVPRYTHLMNGNGGKFNGEDEIYVPFKTAIDAEVTSNGNTSCPGESGAGYKGLLESECTWIQFWFELAAASERGALQNFMENYVNEQRRLGRFERPVPARIYDVMEWMEFMQVVNNDNKAAVWLSLGFLLLCVINTMGLLLAKFSVRGPEVGVRRALGATRPAIIAQFLVETSVIGLAGGVLGLLLSLGSLWVIRQQSRDLSVVAHMDWPMLGLTLAIALGASLFAGLLPTWRASRVTPALQLKSQ
ncbi:MAG: ABC transporter permease [Pseudomonadota bacterium]